MTRSIVYSLFAFLACALYGCGNEVVKAYDGPPHVDNAVAVLFTAKSDAQAPADFQAVLSGVDGKNYGTYLDGYPSVTRVLPGQHTIKVLCYGASSGSRGLSNFLLFSGKFEAGHFYALTCNLRSASYTDRGTDFNAVRGLLPDSMQNSSPSNNTGK